MGLETRKGSGTYYTRSFRRDGRVLRQYVGSGVIARCLAKTDARDRKKRRSAAQAARAAGQARRSAVLAEEKVLIAMQAAIFQRVRNAMNDQGFTASRRGIWRQTMPRRQPPDQPERTPEEHAALIKRGEAYDLDALGALLDDPDKAALEVDFGDPLASIELDLVESLNPTTMARAATHRAMASMRTVLDEPDPNGQARYLVDLVVFSHYAWIVAAGRMIEAQRRHSSKADVEFLDRVLTRAHKRALSAHDGLDRYRRAKPRPLVQVNVAQQVVIAPLDEGAQSKASPNGWFGFRTWVFRCLRRVPAVRVHAMPGSAGQ